MALLEQKRTSEDLKAALLNVKTLQGLLPICSSCKKIRDDKGYWTMLEEYLIAHTDAMISHSICEDCAEKLYGHHDWYQNKKSESE